MKTYIYLLICLMCFSSELKAQDNATNMNDWANFARYDAANKALKETPKIVFMGNSITDLWEQKHPAFFTQNHFLCRGISGQTSSEMLVRFRADVINLHPQAVIINAGINDIARNNGFITLENVMGNIASMAELALANHIRPILTSVLPANRFGWRPQINPADEVIKLNKLIKEFARLHKLTYIDYYSSMVDKEKGLPSKYSEDGVHPTLEGYHVMEHIVLKALGSNSHKR